VIATQIFPIRDRMKCVDTTAGPGRAAAVPVFVGAALWEPPESLTGPAIGLGTKGFGVAGFGADFGLDTGFGARAFPAVPRPFLTALAAFPCIGPAFIPAIAAC
jgi:hypothetical protein